ncbi:hypothetical protein LINPERHAP2_LOCUS18983 [Linum perenne]
MKIIVSYK